LVSKKDREEFEEMNEMQQDTQESDNQNIQQDFALAQAKNYPSDMLPQDMFQYKKLRMVPESRADFQNVIDKDFVLANVDGKLPTIEETKFQVGTFNLVKQVFVTDELMPLFDKEGNAIFSRDGTQIYIKNKGFDRSFEPIANFLLGEIKSGVVLSRAKGKDREAVLDITTNLRKEVNKRKMMDDKTMGFGGL